MPTCHLFCRVIDNHGDLGVCWRLARQLRAEHGLDVTLLVDDLQAFALLAPAVNPSQPRQRLDGLSLRHWTDDLELAPADLVIEGFACVLPDRYVQAMAGRATPPVWLNLEYLSAEAWVADCHGLPSPHPRTGLVKHFWFPGFTAGTGGLLRETGLSHRLDNLDRQTARDALGVARGDRLLTLFCYPSAPLASLFDALAAAAQATTVAVFAGKSLDAANAAQGTHLQPGDRWHRGALTVRALPLLPQADYDALLACADLNLVRGEDSFVRAQWAGQPLLWHIYPQAAEAHLDKLAAWADALTAQAALPAAWHAALATWNGREPALPPTWDALLAQLPVCRTGFRAWRDSLLRQPDLATQLMRFYADRVESRPN